MGDAGGINISTGSMTLTNGGRVSASTFGQGNAGSINITASDKIMIDGENSESDSNGVFTQVILGAVGNGGGVTINTGSMTVTNGGRISAGNFGQGNAGSINITASDSITIDGEASDRLPSTVFSAIGGDRLFSVSLGNALVPSLDSMTLESISDAQRDAGDINITTSSLTLTNGGTVGAAIFSQGNAGSINITASDKIMIDGGGSFFPSGISNAVFPGAVGKAGNVTINTGSLSLTNGGRVDSSTFGQGNAGSVNITASDTISIDGGSSFSPSDGLNQIFSANLENIGGFSGATSLVSSGAKGNAGNVTINTGSLSLTNEGRVEVSSAGEGNGGSLEITARDAITIDGGLALSEIEATGVGTAGNITINTGNLFLTNKARLESNNLGRGNAGSIVVQASDTVSLTKTSSISSSIGDFDIFTIRTRENVGRLQRQPGVGVPQVGNISIIEAREVSLSDGSILDTSTYGDGDSGTITINADETVSFDGEFNSVPSGAYSSVYSNAEGSPGDIKINTGSLTLTNGAVVDVSTYSQDSDGGNLTVNARESITISDIGQPDGEGKQNRSGLFASALEGSGNGGDVNVFTNQLTIKDGATIEASNFDSLGVDKPGTGEPGNIKIKANSLSLSNGAIIEGATQSKTGDTANINLILDEDLTLKGNSSISARAEGNASGGNLDIKARDLNLQNNSLISARASNKANGGNLDIDARFILGFPSQGDGNDLIATAEEGNGGNININAQQIFNLQEGQAIDENGERIPNNRNDIDASSDFGLDGTIEISEPDVNLAQDERLSTEVVDVERLIAQNLCQRGDESEFIITGKGGMAPSPSEPRDGEISEVDLVEPAPFVEDGEEEDRGEPPLEIQQASEDSSLPEEEIVQAQGWIINEQGKIRLVAYKTDPNSSPTRAKEPPVCHQ